MDNYLIPNLVKSCEILRILAECPDGVTAVKLEEQVQVPRTTAFRILKTLCSEGMAEKRGKLFFPGPDLVQVGLHSLRSLKIHSLSIPFLSELAKKTGLTAHLAILSGRHSLILEVHDSPHPVRVASRPGTTVPLYCSSTGKIFLAYRFENELEDYFETTSIQKFTDNTITTLPEMQEEVKQIRKNGFAIDHCEFHEDIWCLASPVRDGTSRVVGAIGVTGPSVQARRQEKDEISEYVKKAARELSIVLGYHS